MNKIREDNSPNRDQEILVGPLTKHWCRKESHHPLRSFHRDPLMRGPRPDHRDVGVIDSLDANVNIFPAVRRVRPADDFIPSGLVDEARRPGGASGGPRRSAEAGGWLSSRVSA
jgi:hypothetical protein